MVTVHEKCITEKQRFVLPFFLWEKGLNSKDIHKKNFFVYCGKCLWRKAVHNLVDKLPPWLQMLRWWRRGRHGGAEMDETTVRKDFYAAGFVALVKRRDKCINVGGAINVFPRFEYDMFYVLYPFVTCLLTLPHTFCFHYPWYMFRPSTVLHWIILIEPLHSLACVLRQNCIIWLLGIITGGYTNSPAGNYT
jgi:hypothetical protein